MPVPRLFEASSDPREQWVHVVATLLALGGPETRTALVEEISGEALPDADASWSSSARPLAGRDRGRRRRARGGLDLRRCRRRSPSTATRPSGIAATYDALTGLRQVHRHRGHPRPAPPEVIAALAASGA